MKFVVVFAAFVAVACASPILQPTDSSLAELEAIVAAIQSPHTHPATAALLEQQLAELLASFIPQPAPVIVEESPVSIGPALIDFPLPDGGAVSAETPAVVPAPVPSPVVPAPAAVAEAAATPLVQIILNINQASDVATAPAAISPAPVEAPVVAVHPVNVVEEAVNVDSILPSPVAVAPVVIVDAAPEPVVVVDAVPEPVLVGTPIVPIPVVTLPEILN